MELSPRFVERLIFGFGPQRRRTQDSPVLPDVWAFYATPSEDLHRREGRSAARTDAAAEAPPEKPLELLLTPHRESSPATLAKELRQRLDDARQACGDEDRAKPRIAYTQSYVVARLHFDEVVRVLLPLTGWWREQVWSKPFKDRDRDGRDDRRMLALLDLGIVAAKAAGVDDDAAHDSWQREWLAAQLSQWSRDLADAQDLSDDLLWMLRVVGTIEWARQLPPPERGAAAEAAPPTWNGRPVEIDEKGRIADFPRLATTRPDGQEATSPPSGEGDDVDHRAIVDAACDLLLVDLPLAEARHPSLFLINRNRPASPSVIESRRAIKADAAIALFGISCEKLIWAVIDTGIDAEHPAFQETEVKEAKGKKGKTGAKPAKAGAAPVDAHPIARSRVRKTYDFTRLRPLLDHETVRDLLNAADVKRQTFDDLEIDALLQPIRELIAKRDDAGRAAGCSVDENGNPRTPLRAQLADLKNRLLNDREIDWELLDPLLEVPHEEGLYKAPATNHGTHVAGILAANWPDKGVVGVCKDLRLYDLRVIDPRGPNDEFTVLAALQFVQYLNRQKEAPIVQGANLSLSIKHEVTNYACGRTPVCDECDRLVASGVVVVTAGGNAGWDDELARAAVGAGYRTVSITDPGNAESVITVGATHRDRPHSYGVSFFSSRGPTGDGRAKPDLVAPGEKITSTIPGERKRREDGTSMAAPHVSGAAALLMARHRELVGQPRRIKEILCRTATDLGRERHFQGAGMLDVLRALQSV